MTKPDDVSQVLRDRMDYDPQTGSFTWKYRPLDTFPNERIGKGWNTRFVGKPIFVNPDADGYFRSRVMVDGRNYRITAQAAAFAIVNGRMAKETVDHINRNKSDNRYSNLREATHAENMRNFVHPSQYLTGTRPRGMKWEARVACDKMSYYLGLYDTEVQAHEAYKVKANELHGEFAAFAKE